jgi:hypothetical protein
MRTVIIIFGAGVAQTSAFEVCGLTGHPGDGAVF